LPFCRYVPQLHRLASSVATADFVVVYITEAHAQDEWPIGDPLKINQPVTDAERVGIARQFAADYDLQLPVLVDPVANHFEQAYAAWPIRFYVLEESFDNSGRPLPKLVYKAQPDHNNTYDSIIPDLEGFLASRYGA